MAAPLPVGSCLRRLRPWGAAARGTGTGQWRGIEWTLASQSLLRQLNEAGHRAPVPPGHPVGLSNRWGRQAVQSGIWQSAGLPHAGAKSGSGPSDHMVFGAAAGNAVSASAPRASFMAVGTRPVSKQHRLMQGPMAALISAGSLPNSRSWHPPSGAIPAAVPATRRELLPPPGGPGHKTKWGVQSAVKSSGSPPAHPSQGRPVPAPPGGTDPPPGFPGPPGHNIRMGLPGKHRLLGESPRPPPGSVVSQHPPGWSPLVNAQIQAGQAPGAHAPNRVEKQ